MTVGKEKEKKSRERKGEKSMVALSFFILATSEKKNN